MNAFPLISIAPADEFCSRRSEATLVALRDGSVLVAYGRHIGPEDPGFVALRNRASRGPGNSPTERDNDFGEIVGIRLDGTAKPLSPEHVLVPSPLEGLNAMSPAMRRLPDGRIGMAYSHRTSTRVASRRFITSSDEGATWSNPVVIDEEGYRTGCHDRLLVHSSGRLIAPCHGGDDFDDHHRQVRVAWSDNAGASWAVGQPIDLPHLGWPGAIGSESGCVEPGVVERADGSVLMTMRTAMGTQFRSESYDAGKTWSSPRSMEVSSPCAAAHLSRLPGSNRLLLIWNPDYDARAPMNGHRRTLLACVSEDDGCSWPWARRRVLVDDPNRNTDYPVAFFHHDEVWVGFRQSDDPQVIRGRMSTRLMRVPLAWLLK